MFSSRITNLAEIGLRVANLEKMSAFYQTILGFEVQNKYPNHVFLKIAELQSPLGEVGHPLILGLFDRNNYLNVKASTLDHLAFEIPSEFYADEREHFKSKGVVISERSWPDSLDWQACSFFFYDPEGNIIEIIASNTAEA